MWARRSRLANPSGRRRNTTIATSRAWTRRSANPRRSSLVADDDGLGDLGEGGLADGGVVADSLDVEETSVGSEADLPECGQVGQPFPDAEIAGVVDGRLGAKGDSFLVVLLHAGGLVLDVQGRRDTVGEHPGPEPAGCRVAAPVLDPAIEYEADPVGAADVEVLADDFFEEHPARQGPVQDLGQGELGLEDGDVVAVSGPPVRRGERVRQTGEPLADEPVDLGWVQAVTDVLEATGVGAGREAVVERFEPDPCFGRLAFGPLVAVQADLGVVGEVRTELDEERPEVLVDGIHVEVVHDRRAANQPRIRGPGDRVAALLGAKHRGLLLSPAHEQHPVGPGEGREVLMRDVVLPLTRAEVNKINPLVSDEPVDAGDRRQTPSRSGPSAPTTRTGSRGGP